MLLIYFPSKHLREPSVALCSLSSAALAHALFTYLHGELTARAARAVFAGSEQTLLFVLLR